MKQLLSKFLRQIVPKVVSEHKNTKNFLGACPQTPPRGLIKLNPKCCPPPTLHDIPTSLQSSPVVHGVHVGQPLTPCTLYAAPAAYSLQDEKQEALRCAWCITLSCYKNETKTTEFTVTQKTLKATLFCPRMVSDCGAQLFNYSEHYRTLHHC